MPAPFETGPDRMNIKKIKQLTQEVREEIAAAIEQESAARAERRFLEGRLIELERQLAAIEGNNGEDARKKLPPAIVADSRGWRINAILVSVLEAGPRGLTVGEIIEDARRRGIELN